MLRRLLKLLGRRKAGTYGRTAKKAAKRRANKAVRRWVTGKWNKLG